MCTVQPAIVRHSRPVISQFCSSMYVCTLGVSPFPQLHTFQHGHCSISLYIHGLILVASTVLRNTCSLSWSVCPLFLVILLFMILMKIRGMRCLTWLSEVWLCCEHEILANPTFLLMSRDFKLFYVIPLTTCLMCQLTRKKRESATEAIFFIQVAGSSLWSATEQNLSLWPYTSYFWCRLSFSSSTFELYGAASSTF